MTLPVRVKRRLFVWIVACVAVLAGQVLLPLRSGRVVAVGGLAVIFGLLCTTPGDAVRLPRGASETVILISSVAVHLRDHSRLAIGQIAVTALLLAMLRWRRKSAWWSVLAGWIPG